MRLNRLFLALLVIAALPAVLNATNRDSLDTPDFGQMVADCIFSDFLAYEDLSEGMERGYTPFELIDTTIAQQIADLNARTPISLHYNSYVHAFINLYLNKRRGQVERMMGLADYYFPLFEATLDRYNLPLELKYLAIVESALNPRATSYAGAKGLWQFMYSTGKIYGLEVSSYVDDRSDPIKATAAACAFMENLYDIYGDWLLVLAAYNSGPGNVNKAIRRSGGQRDFWAIRPYLPKETRSYVPSFIAVNYVFEHAENYGLQRAVVAPDHQTTDTVMTRELIVFEDLAAELSLDLEVLRFLNPSYKLDIIPAVPGKSFPLVLPHTYTDDFIAIQDSLVRKTQEKIAANQTSLPDYVEMNDRIRYKVQPGDYLGKIAGKYNCSVSDIMRWNNMKSTQIRAGAYLTLYVRSVKAMEGGG
jgi:membrane-bound lytic murein transglycosylase D